MGWHYRQSRRRLGSFPLFFDVSVSERFDVGQHAAFESEPSHELPRPKVVDELRNQDLLVVVSGPLAEQDAPGRRAMSERMKGPDDVAEIPHGRRFSAVRQHLGLEHSLEDQLAAAAQRVRRTARKEQDAREQSRGSETSRRPDASYSVHE